MRESAFKLLGILHVEHARLDLQRTELQKQIAATERRIDALTASLLAPPEKWDEVASKFDTTDLPNQNEQ